MKSIKKTTQCCHIWLALLALSFTVSSAGAASRWGANYFPNVELTTQDGEAVLFFDDLIKDKIVAINFIYTTCVDSCPLETAQLIKVQHIIGDRLGKDVFIYSITIDPEHDTPSVLKEYKARFGANWTFLTGAEADIIELRKKLGLYMEEIQDESLNHNVSMIIGNQATGRWMKRSPFENPYVLADQLGNWLDGWKAPPKGGSYADAPKLRSVPAGEQLYRTRCATCHTVTGKEEEGALGPDLLGVTERRELTWLLNWLRAPDQMLDAKDPIALALYEQYNQLAMPNMRLNQQEARDLLDYVEQETLRVRSGSDPSGPLQPGTAVAATGDSTQLSTYRGGDVVAVMNAWIREAHPAAMMNGGYLTLVNVADSDATLIGIESDAFDKVEVHEMAVVDGLRKMRQLGELVVPAQGQVKMQPGGMHLMLIGPREPLTDGQQIQLTLLFEGDVSQTVLVKVAAS
jgi:copper(I)-binding protein/cytochrome oxidase Cu insertion factor (SCO1/SenC/PrrC family)